MTPTGRAAVDSPMAKRSPLTQGQGRLGVTLVWSAILAPFAFSIVSWARSNEAHYDSLLPAERFPTVFAGGLGLLWAACQAHRRIRIIGWWGLRRLR